MRRTLPHVAILLLLAACEPSWRGSAPVSHGQAASPERPGSVTVYSGDTVYSVARRYNLSVRELIEANNLRAPYQLTPGTVLRLPGGGNDYVVQKGDTLIGIARRFHVDFASLAATNSKKAPYVLQPGERLRIPGAATTATAVAAAPPSSPGGPIVVTSPNARPGSGPPPAPPPLSQRQAEAAPAAPGQPQTPAQTAFAPTPTLSPAVPGRAGSGFLWPVKGEVLAEYGPMPGKGQHNDGINIAAPKGTPVKAAENGVVAYVGNELKGFGNLLLVKHSDGWMTAYAHADQLLVRKGDQVRRGQQIATVGASGSATSPQLHFEIRHGTQAVNPVEYLRDAMAAVESEADASI